MNPEQPDPKEPNNELSASEVLVRHSIAMDQAFLDQAREVSTQTEARLAALKFATSRLNHFLIVDRFGLDLEADELNQTQIQRWTQVMEGIADSNWEPMVAAIQSEARETMLDATIRSRIADKDAIPLLTDAEILSSAIEDAANQSESDARLFTKVANLI